MTPAQRQLHRHRVLRRRALHALEHALLALAVFAIVFPIAWMVATAFKDRAHVYEISLLFRPVLDGFRAVFGPQWQVGRFALHSLVISLATVAVAVPVSVCAAYAFSRYRFRLRRTLFQLLLITQFIPAVAVVLPLFVLFRRLEVLDTYGALIAVDLAIVLPYAIWTIKGFIDAVPLETEEAAKIDGASLARLLLSIVVPMARPGIITAAIFCFILTWNEFLFALVLTRNRVVPLSVRLIGFRTEHGDLWELIAATGIVITVPMFFLAMIIQRHFTRGLTLGAGK